MNEPWKWWFLKWKSMYVFDIALMSASSSGRNPEVKCQRRFQQVDLLAHVERVEGDGDAGIQRDVARLGVTIDVELSEVSNVADLFIAPLERPAHDLQLAYPAHDGRILADSQGDIRERGR